ncbi:MAG TPA: 16S rRNA methyltransferase [Clostridiales bacterium UBA8960]|jgi:16S rRNA (uracil1498-N3)-methyltransferase|nr:16S rRNA methyltransferase [Clostridiales bacterium UBA8960]
MHRFFFEDEDQRDSNTVVLKNAETVSHLSRVLRIKIGEQIEIVMEHTVLTAEVKEVSNDAVSLNILAEGPHENESSIQIDLYQCLPKGQKLELILQKNVELGVHAFYLVQSKRCVVDYKPKDVPKKLERLSKIVKEASKQSKRDVIPNINGILSIKETLDKISNYDQFLVLYEREDAESLKHRLQASSSQKIAVLIGPEGGLDQLEVDALVNHGAQSTTLGKRILRTETAGFVAVSCIQYEMNALG